MNKREIEKPVSYTGNTAYKSLDLCGLRCPRLLNSTNEAIGLVPSQELRIQPAARNTTSSRTAWSHQNGNELPEPYQEGDCFVSRSKRKSKRVEVIESMSATKVQKEEGRTLPACH